ncbi:potassium channel family protein [Variovorax paradoxus]|uniref:Putative potassium uptake protein, TrkA family n=1 Tax=Variovorax paradoxus B4 TaxID=1246301 RepID=T1X6K4_VARPD|nr:TrkA family potassium uptake protein [Variovorax paradoxus]AGU48552.1 putative potassium uptake protein, TrkA family [Variovorax paradoxus B4]WPH15399.1 TrkA family potassium uptake protein [Variovorax paradoxus]
MLGSRNNADSVVVIGLGRFGSGVARALAELGHDVLAIDTDAEAVQAHAGVLGHVVQADATDLESLKQLGVNEFQHAVVSIGQNLEASVLTILNLSQMGNKDIWAKANSQQHGRIAERVGAHHVVYPEADMGRRVAHLVTGKMIDFIEFEDGFAIAKTRAPSETHGKPLSGSAVRTRHGVTVVGIKRRHEDFIYAKENTVVKPGDLLIVAGPTEAVERFAARV